MPTYIILLDFTEQGVQKIKDTTKRADAFAEAAKKAGITVKDVYWTSGEHDGVLILEAPDDETVSASLLSLAKQGNVRSHTLRAFTRSEIESIIDKIG
ncbi:GYD domain-containing protein [candidate division KSB1 bacterium]|nr:GYD domain-containing protein [candidate division KSB1 bacterium]NIR71181.1 GYD domain-containing protein [candidate division KSB1 bacterium]NIS26166.1 GYD domain-containing protein [candidate division KSB1 bacterium]NIT72931.1 GYD domain-containing protein [candidate division KSB1 bacterium]NIU26813.1 GYD domain-containing protein [candidate division KSB1 bacterium]